MIDTVVLAIARGRITVRDLDNKGRPMWDQHTRAKGFETFIRNPSQSEYESGDYFPRITGVNSGNMTAGTSRIKIEFSVPKLLYGNNVDEVDDSEFESVIALLQSRLNTMGIDLPLEALRRAPVMAVHYSKNVDLGKFAVADAIRELEKINVRKGIDFARAHYRNDGQSITAYATEHSFIFYDKVADLSKRKKKAIDKDQTQRQVNLASQLQGQNILRYEVRLTSRRKLNSVLVRLGHPINPTFADIYAPDKSMIVLDDYWQKATTNGSAVLFAAQLSAKDVLRKILSTQVKRAHTAIYLVGLILLARDSGGMRELRLMLNKLAGDRTWSRISATLKAIALRLAGVKADRWFGKVESALKSYKPFRTAGQVR